MVIKSLSIILMKELKYFNHCHLCFIIITYKGIYNTCHLKVLFLWQLVTRLWSCIYWIFVLYTQHLLKFPSKCLKALNHVNMVPVVLIIPLSVCQERFHAHILIWHLQHEVKAFFQKMTGSKIPSSSCLWFWDVFKPMQVNVPSYYSFLERWRDNKF